MAVVFTKMPNGKVKVEDGASVYMLNGSLNVAPHNINEHFIIIGPGSNPVFFSDSKVIDWRDITTPVVTSRADAIEQLGTDFFFEIDVEDIETRITNLEDRYEYYEIFESTSSGSGQVSIPTNAEIILNFYPEGVDALATKLDTQGRPMDEPPLEADGSIVTTTFDVNGNYVLSGVPTAYPIGLVYFIRIEAQYSDNVLYTQLVQQFQVGDEHIANKVVSIGSASTDIEYPSAKATYNSIEDAKAFAVAMATAL